MVNVYLSFYQMVDVYLFFYQMVDVYLFFYQMVDVYLFFYQMVDVYLFFYQLEETDAKLQCGNKLMFNIVCVAVDILQHQRAQEMGSKAKAGGSREKRPLDTNLMTRYWKHLTPKTPPLPRRCHNYSTNISRF